MAEHPCSSGYLRRHKMPSRRCIQSCSRGPCGRARNNPQKRRHPQKRFLRMAQAAANSRRIMGKGQRTAERRQHLYLAATGVWILPQQAPARAFVAHATRRQHRAPAAAASAGACRQRRPPVAGTSKSPCSTCQPVAARCSCSSCIGRQRRYPGAHST